MRYSLVGRGDLQFLIKVRDDMSCPYTGNPQANIVAIHGDGYRVLHFAHMNKDEALRF